MCAPFLATWPAHVATRCSRGARGGCRGSAVDYLAFVTAESGSACFSLSECVFSARRHDTLMGNMPVAASQVGVRHTGTCGRYSIWTPRCLAARSLAWTLARTCLRSP